MPAIQTFDLATYLSERFPSLTLGGGLFYRWPIAVRFELGLEKFRERARDLYEAVFAPEDSCVIISQNRPEDIHLPERYFQVFNLPNTFDSKYPLEPRSLELTTEEDGERETTFLQWAQLPAPSFQYSSILEAIAKADHAQTPSVSGRVYFLNPAREIIMHMYDDRGLDVIAASKGTIMPIYLTFSDWVLESSREQVAKALL
jgi:hypothetical protein